MRAFVVETWSSRGIEDAPRHALAWPARRTISTTIRLLGALGFMVAVVVWLAHALHHAPAIAPVSEELSAPAWRDLDKPEPLYRLAAPDFTAEPATYTARLHAAGGREDVLSLGQIDGAAPALRLRIFRRAAEPARRAPLFAAIAHEAAQSGLSVERSGLPEILPTRFGRFEIADVALAGMGGAVRTCSGFRLVRDAPALSISGVACGAVATPLPRSTVACLVDRLEAVGGADGELTAFFTQTAAERDPACPGTDADSGDKPGDAAAAEDEKPGKPATSRKSLRRH